MLLEVETLGPLMPSAADAGKATPAKLGEAGVASGARRSPRSQHAPLPPRRQKLWIESLKEIWRLAKSFIELMKSVGR